MKAGHFAGNTLLLTLARGLSFGGRAIVLLALAWTAPPAELAACALVVTLAETARVIGDLGVETWLIRAIGLASSTADASRAAKIGLLLRMFTASTGGVIVFVLARGIASDQYGIGWIAALLTITGLIGGVPMSVLQAHMELRKLLYSQIPVLSAGLYLAVFAAHKHAPPNVILCILAISESLTVCAMLFQSGLVATWRMAVGVLEVRSVLRACLPVAFFNALVGTYSRLDIWFLAFMSADSVPTYTVAFRLYQPWSLLTASVAGVAYAAMTRAFRHDANARFEVNPKVIRASLAVAAALMVSLVGVGDLVIDKLLPRYQDAEPLLMILALLIPILGFNGLCTAVLSVRGKFVMLCKLASFNVVVFAILLFALVPAYGALGAGVALVIGEISNSFIQGWILRPIRASRLYT